jgi:hypothetical protein
MPNLLSKTHRRMTPQIHIMKILNILIDRVILEELPKTLNDDLNPLPNNHQMNWLPDLLQQLNVNEPLT